MLRSDFVTASSKKLGTACKVLLKKLLKMYCSTETNIVRIELIYHHLFSKKKNPNNMVSEIEDMNLFHVSNMH